MLVYLSLITYKFQNFLTIDCLHNKMCFINKLLHNRHHNIICFVYVIIHVKAKNVLSMNHSNNFILVVISSINLIILSLPIEKSCQRHLSHLKPYLSPLCFTLTMPHKSRDPVVVIVDVITKCVCLLVYLFIFFIVGNVGNMVVFFLPKLLPLA